MCLRCLWSTEDQDVLHLLLESCMQFVCSKVHGKYDTFVACRRVGYEADIDLIDVN